MAKQVLIPLGLVIVFIIAVGLFIQKYPSYNATFKKDSEVQEVKQKTVTIGAKKIDVEIANTPVLRQKGLSNRSSLAENSGMLFVFDSKPVAEKFWMKDMLIPIDIIWIRNNKVSEIYKNVPFYPKGIPDNQLKIYSPKDPADYVLEVNSGFSDKNNFKVGDSVILPNL